VVIIPFCAKPEDTERRPPGTAEPLPIDQAVIEALRAAHDRGATMLSFCSGAFALAEAGLLDGKQATTHWMYAQAFRRRFPKVDFVEDVLYVDNGQVLTSAGSASAIDLSLHFIRREHGADVADIVARRMVVPPHRDGGQAQYVAPPAPDVSATGFGELLDWMLVNLGQDLSVEDLAARAAMSPRSFARHFQQATGTTPHRWLTARRVDHARRLLETTDWSIDRVAAESGLGSAANLRARMDEAIGVTPTAYRRRFARTA
jgi:transcriptional regulator GlxA family with amidase domain